MLLTNDFAGEIKARLYHNETSEPFVCGCHPGPMSPLSKAPPLMAQDSAGPNVGGVGKAKS